MTMTLEKIEQKTMREPNSGCHLWLGAMSVNGYGYCQRKKKNYLIHRLVWELKRGPIPNGLCVLHRCDTPLCVNPEHLFLGTQLDNIRDMATKKRSPSGAKHYRTIHHTNEELTNIRSATGTCREIAERFGYSTDYIWRLRK